MTTIISHFQHCSPPRTSKIPQIKLRTPNISFCLPFFSFLSLDSKVQYFKYQYLQLFCPYPCTCQGLISWMTPNVCLLYTYLQVDLHQTSANIWSKRSDYKYFRLWGPTTHLCHWCFKTAIENKWTCLCSNNTLFTKRDHNPHLTRSPDLACWL